MAKKGAKNVIATRDEKAAKAVRLELPIADYQRLERHARKLGLNRASFARMAVLKAIGEADEEERRKAGAK
jgi:hypothetical protein